MKNERCMICRSGNLSTFMDLGLQPNGNNFPTIETQNAEPKFPMAMQVCRDCWLVQIVDFPAPEFLFTDQPYITGVNVPIVRHFERLAARLARKFSLPPQSLVVDIGCNDGTLLRMFAAQGMRVLGVDPGLRTGELAREQGITVCRAFWSRETGCALRQLGLQPRLITATAVFYHLADLHDFVEGLKEVMTPEAVFVVQCVYLKDLIERNQFDHFYHEHSCIHSVGPLRRLFEQHGMRLLDVEFTDIHGGSFILSVGLGDSPRPTHESITRAVEAEKEAGLLEFGTYEKFTQRVKANAAELARLLRQIKSEGKSVRALGAPVKGATLLNYCGVGADLIECATEVNPFKIGRLTAGSHIPIVAEDSLSDHPDYYLILSWNFLDYFIGKFKDYLMQGGKFIVPVPTVRVLSLGPAQEAPGDSSGHRPITSKETAV